MRKQTGFTLLELMITISVFAILAAIAVPNLQEFLVRTQRQQVVSDLTSAIAVARSEAVKRALPVTLAGKTSGSRALQDGWQIFTDPARSGVYSASAGSVTTLISEQAAYPANQLLVGRDASPQLTDAGAEYLQFDSLGRISTLTGSNGSYGITVVVQRNGVDKIKSALCIGWAGRVRLVNDKANSDSGACVG